MELAALPCVLIARRLALRMLCFRMGWSRGNQLGHIFRCLGNQWSSSKCRRRYPRLTYPSRQDDDYQQMEVVELRLT